MAPDRDPATNLPVAASDSTAWITEEQMVEVDRAMIDDIGITLLQMMENAGRSLSRLVLRRFGPSRVQILTGSGGNGGGGLVAARHLTNAGIDVSVTSSRPPEALSGAAGHQLRVLNAMGVALDPEPRSDADVVVDAVLGYSLNGPPRNRAEALISWANTFAGPVVALDNPSGLEVTTGRAPGVVVQAEATLTLALPKLGLRAAAEVGDLYLADISVPSTVYEAMGVGPLPSFRAGPILRLEP